MYISHNLHYPHKNPACYNSKPYVTELKITFSIL